VPEAFLEPILRWFRYRQVIAHIPVDTKVLDVGCGRSAAFLKAIAPKIHQGVGVDFKAEPMKTSNIETFQLRLEYELPFADESFDVVTLLAVLEHIEHEKLILKEIHRVLRKDGRLIITVPSVWSQSVLEFLSYRLQIVDEMEIRDHKRYYNRSLLRNVLIEETQFRNFYHQYFQCWMNNFCMVVK
jgi:ubiquinone/menaquinone biosynthesis C-methylase UbiE